MVVLRVTLRQDLCMSSHVQSLLTKGNQLLYALKILKAYGLSGQCLFNICRATLISGLIYASPAQWGFCSVEERDKLQAIVRKAVRWGFYDSAQSIDSLCESADTNLFSSVLQDPRHVLHQLLPLETSHTYSLRKRPHNRVLPSNNVTSSKNFIHRMLYKDIY